MRLCTALVLSFVANWRTWPKTRARPTQLNESALTFVLIAVHIGRTRPLHRKNRQLGETVIH